MSEREVNEVRMKHWLARYKRLDEELEKRVAERRERELLTSFELLLSGFGGSASAYKYFKRKVWENA